MSPVAIPILAMITEAQGITDLFDARGLDHMGVSNKDYAFHVLTRYGLYADVRAAAGWS